MNAAGVLVGLALGATALLMARLVRDARHERARRDAMREGGA